MFYRVVMMGRTIGGADLEEVKKQFVRVTGLPMNVAEQMFGGMPQVVKRQVARRDAERIAATLRAIGAVATVERELIDAADDSPAGIRVAATPLHNGPPTIIPGMETAPVTTAAPSRYAQLLRKIRGKGIWLAGTAMLVPAVFLLQPFIGDYFASAPPKPAPASPVAARAADQQELAPGAPLEVNLSWLRGPWRCTDQRTGESAYWSYVENGALIAHGDVLSDKPPPLTISANAPTEWAIDGENLMHKYSQRPPDTYKLQGLTLTRLRYGDGRKLEIECRRP
ncbi:MAG: hypothetical protein ABIO63_11160 [Casimicrobiaceae bacterium]